MRFLNGVERVGNKLPDPVTIFFALWFIVMIISAIVAKSGVTAVHPGTGETVSGINLLSKEQMQLFLKSILTNFTGFAPLGLVLVTMLGAGLAEKVGMMEVMLKSVTNKIPKKLVTAAVIFIGIMANAVADAGFVVFPPLAALIYIGIGRHPLTGMFAAYAGVAAGFSANLIISMLDALVAGFTIPAAQIIDPNYTSTPAMNYYFLIVSCFILTAIGTFVTEKYIAPRFDGTPYEDTGYDANAEVTPEEKKGLKYAGIAVLIYIVIVVALCIGPNAFMKDPETGSLLASSAPLMAGMVPLITLLFFIPGVIYGVVAGKIKNDKDVAALLYESMAGMGSYIVLAFAAGQFLALFNSSNMSALLAIKGAEWLKNIGLTGPVLIIAFVIFACFINMFVGSCSAKWAIMAPIFVPMFMLLGYSPALTQMAYRIGDSITNPISPIFTYFPVILAYAKKYDKDTGMGTIMAAMLPYSMIFLVAWIVLLLIFMMANIPLGPNGNIYL
ncbi:MAG: AbgT family transporter [Intestinibacter sp.]|uniref:AbgT family transporter n=1 Tax=Intestinibacter sp. TaxID=1965304 RepID=UPI003F17A1E7